MNFRHGLECWRVFYSIVRLSSSSPNLESRPGVSRYLLSAPLYVMVSPSTMHGARSNENKLATLESIILRGRDLHDEKENINNNLESRHCPLSSHEPQLVSSKRHGRQGFGTNQYNPEAEAPELAPSPQTGVHSPIGSAEDRFPFCVRQYVLNTRIREPVPCAVARSVPSFNVAAQMGLSTWQGGSRRLQTPDEHLRSTARNNFPQLWPWWVSD